MPRSTALQHSRRLRRRRDPDVVWASYLAGAGAAIATRILALNRSRDVGAPCSIVGRDVATFPGMTASSASIETVTSTFVVPASAATLPPALFASSAECSPGLSRDPQRCAAVLLAAAAMCSATGSICRCVRHLGDGFSGQGLAASAHRAVGTGPHSRRRSRRWLLARTGDRCGSPRLVFGGRHESESRPLRPAYLQRRLPVLGARDKVAMVAPRQLQRLPLVIGRRDS